MLKYTLNFISNELFMLIKKCLKALFELDSELIRFIFAE